MFSSSASLENNESQAVKKSKVTLSVKHEDFVSKFENQQTKLIPAKKKRVDVLKKQIAKLEAKKNNGEKLNATEHTQLFQMQKELKQLQNDLKLLNDKNEENKYFLKTAHVLTEYDKTQVPNSKQKSKKKTREAEPQTTSILSFLNKPPQPKVQPPPPVNSDADKGKITSFFQMSKNTANRAQLQDIYMQCIDPTHMSDEKYRTYDKNPNKCQNEDCGAIDCIVYNNNLGRRYCEECGCQIDLFFDSSFNSFKATASIELTPEFPYKRENHVSEWLAKIQGKENTEIPEEVFKALEKEFKKYKYGPKDYTKLKPDFVKKCLKDLGLNKFYDHKEYIIHRFNGLPPPQLSIELEETFKRMFMQIQDPFEKHCPPSRKNFLSYSYVFHKFCQLLELDDLLVYFPLLKSREKLFEQDKIWKQICKELRWGFIPSL